MALQDILQPKPKEEILNDLREPVMDNGLLELMNENESVFFFIWKFYTGLEGTSEEKVRQINGLAEIIRNLR